MNEQLIVTLAHCHRRARSLSCYGALVHGRDVCRGGRAGDGPVGRPDPQGALRALLHDIGKIGIAESVLHKPARLTDEKSTST